jgi:hypothetical protein
VRTAKPPFAVEFHHDPNNKFRFNEKTPDDEWMAKVGAEGWIVFSHDRKWHNELPVCAAIKQFNVGCFYLWGANAETWEKMRSFMRGYHYIDECIATNTKPYIFDVAKHGRLTQVPIP